MKVYIAGPMRGRANFNFPAFHAAQVILEKEGHEVFNPAARDEEQYGAVIFHHEHGTQAELDANGFNLREALHADTEFITLHADAVCVLDGWQGSKGATAEVALAHALGLPVYTLLDMQLGGFRLDVPPALKDAERVQNPARVIESGWQPVNPALAAVQEAPRWGWRDGHFTSPSEVREKIESDMEQARRIDRLNGEVREVSESGAMKGVKLARFDLIPVKALTEVAKHYGRTANKYPPNNWRKGYEWSKSYAAIMRHLTQWWDGEDVDVDPAWPEGSPHLAAVAWHALTLLEYVVTETGVDDRPE